MKRVWVGLVGVTRLPGAEFALSATAKGGYVNALAYVSDEAAYRIAVEEALRELGLTAYEYEDVEAFSDRISKWEVDEAIQALADEVETTRTVRFGTFHTYSDIE